MLFIFQIGVFWCEKLYLAIEQKKIKIFSIYLLTFLKLLYIYICKYQFNE